MTSRRRPDNSVLPRRIPCVVAALMIALPCAAQNYPSGPLCIVAPYPPGGGTDILGRTIGQKLNERVGVPVVIDNRSGANGRPRAVNTSRREHERTAL